MKKIIVEELSADHPMRAYGANYNVKVIIDGMYCGVGKFCKTWKEVEEYRKANR